MPTLYTAEERRSSILNNTPGTFTFTDISGPSLGQSVYSLPSLGVDAVKRNEPYISRYAQQYGVDADIVRTFVFLENAQGWFGDRILPYFGYTNTSYIPANIQPSTWQSLVPGENLKNPEVNIKAATLLIRRIQDRMPGTTKTVAATYALYNFLGADRTDLEGGSFNAQPYQAQAIYQQKPWLSNTNTGSLLGGYVESSNNPLGVTLGVMRDPNGTTVGLKIFSTDVNANLALLQNTGLKLINTKGVGSTTNNAPVKLEVSKPGTTSRKIAVKKLSQTETNTAAVERMLWGDGLKLHLNPALTSEDITDIGSFALADASTQTITASGQVVGLESVFDSISKRVGSIASFFTDYTQTLKTYYDNEAGQQQLQTAMAQVITRLVQGEDFNVVMTQISAQLLLAPQAQKVITDLLGGTAQAGSGQAMVQSAVTSFVLQSIVNGGQNMAQVAALSTVQAAVQQGLMNYPSFTTTGPNNTTVLNPAGAGVAAAALTLFSAALNGGINARAIGQAAVAGVVGYSSAAIAASMTGTGTLLGSMGIAAGPVGIIVGMALGYLTQGLFAKTQYIHGETVGNITQTQADGSLLLIGTRPAGSLLRTTGTTNDDYIGNDSATDTAGHDVIVGQAGMNEIYARGGHDMMEGRAAADYIDAGTGDDRIEAGDGNDFADGGNGNDRILGGAGDDSLLGGAGNDQILGGTGNDAIEGQTGRDMLFGGAGNDQLIGGTEDDTLDGGVGDDVLAGEAGNDELDGADGNDIVQGGDGNDIVAGGAGNDNLEGNSGNDKLLGESGVDVLYGGEGDDVLDGGLENDLAFGGLGKDTLIGGYGDDDLYGELGQDLLAGGAGNDLLNGGDDNDVYLFRRNDGNDTIDDAAGVNTLKLLDLNPVDLTAITRVGDDLVLAFGTLDSVTVKGHFLTPGLAKIEFANKQAIDVASLTFNASNVGSYASLLNNQNVLASFAWAYSQYQQANNNFNASTYLTTAWITNNYDTSVTTDAVERELYNDIQVRSWSKGGNIMRAKKVFFYDYYETQLKASGYADRVVGLFAAETIDGGAGNDQLYGNVGADTILGGIDHDIIDGGADNDIISGQTGNDKAFGGTGNDTLNGNEGNDSLYGEEGIDTLNGGSEDDLLSGGEGNDILRGDAGKDLLFGEDGDDDLQGGDDDDMLSGGIGNDTLNGGAGNDLLFGEDGNDTLNGGDGNDIILGGIGTNTVDGGAGIDSLQLSGSISDYTIAINPAGVVTVTDLRPDAPDGITNATNIEELMLSDQRIDLTNLFPRINPITLPRGITYNGLVVLPAGYSINLVQAPAQGTLTLNANGTYSYTSPSTFTGPTSFRYRITSPQGITSTMDAAITVANNAASGGTFTPGADTVVTAATVRNDTWDVAHRRETPIAAKLTGGGYVLTWSNNTAVFYQIYDSSGTAVSAATRPNTVASNTIMAVGLSDGGFVLTWLDHSQTFPRQMWRRYNATGVAQTTEINAIPTPTGGGYWDATGGSIVELNNGNLALIWSARLGGTDYDMFMSVFNPSGTTVVSPVRINSTLGGPQTLPKTVRISNGNVVAVWRDEGAGDGSGMGIYMRIMSPTGTAVGNEILVNTTTTGDQTLPSIVVLVNGDFVISWSSPQDGSGFGIYAQRFNASGVALGAQTLLNINTGGDQQDANLTALSDGGFFATWQSNGQDGSGWGIYGRRFDAQGNAVSGEILINTSTLNAQDLPSVTDLLNGDLIVTWRSWHSGSLQVMQKRLTATNTYMNLVGVDSSETLIAGNTADLINGAGGDDILVGNGGNDTLNGGTGRDVAQYSGNLANYNISIDDGIVQVTDLRSGTPDGVDTLSNLEVLRFADQDFDWTVQQVKLNDIIMPPSRTFTGNITLLAGQTASLVQGPTQGGSITIASNGSFSLTSVANFAGQTSFRYRVTGANGITWTNTINVTVTTQAAGNGAYALGTEQAVFGVSLTGDYWDNFQMRERSEVIRLANDGSVITWTQTDSDGSSQNVNFQIYNAAGVAVGTITRANQTTSQLQHAISATPLSNGNFAVVWTDLQQNASPMWRIFNNSGVAQTNEIKVMPTPVGGGYWDTSGSKITQLANGDLGIVWSGRMGGADYDIYFSRFTTAGVTVGSPIRLNTNLASAQTLPVIATLTNGSLVAVWRDENATDGSGFSVNMRIINADGTFATTEQRVNITTTGDQSMPWVATLVGGDFVVTWSSNGQDGSGFGVYAQRYSAAGVRLGTEFAVNTTTANDQSASTITALSDGGFFVVWNSLSQDGSGLGIYGRRFNANGVGVGSEILLNSSTLNNQELPDITELNNGDLVATWRSNHTGAYQIMRRSLVASSRYINAIGTNNLEMIIGSTTADTLNGGGGNDILIGLNGNDTLDGGIGTDIARYSGNLANYTITLNGSTVTVQDTRSGTPDGTDTLTNTEVLSFADQDLNLSGLFPEIRSLTIPMGATYTGAVALPAGYTMAIQSAATQGTFTLGSNGVYTYAAPASFSGAASVQYRLTSPQGINQIVTMPLTILPAAVGTGGYGLGTEQVVTTYAIANGTWDIANRRESPGSLKLTNGGYVLYWTQQDSDGSAQNIYYCVYNAAGTAVTTALRANTTTANFQMTAYGTSLDDGGFVLGWMDLISQPGIHTGSDVWRRFDATGIAQTAEVRVSPTPVGGGVWDSAGGGMVQQNNGNLAIAWYGRMGADFEVFLSRFSLTGTSLGAPIQVNTTMTGTQSMPHIAQLANGTLAIVWRDEGGNDGSGQGVYLRLMSDVGSPLTAEMRVNTTITGDQFLPNIAALATGGFMVTWASPQDGSGFGVYGQRYDASGVKVGAEFLINTTTTNDQLDHAITSLADGGFYVTWQSNGQDGSGWGIYGKRFDLNGNSVGSETLLNTSTTSTQDMPTITELSNGDLVAAWRSWHSGSLQLVQKRLTAPTGAGVYTLTGTTASETLVGGLGNDLINGNDGNDILNGQGGNDTLSGGAGNDTYQFGLGGGADSINNQDSVGTDRLAFGSGIDRHNVWYQRTGYDLSVQVLGTNDRVTLQNWFTTDAQRVDDFTLTSGYTLDKSKVDQLVSAMAGFNPQALGTVSSLSSLPSSVQAVIVASWV